MPGTVRSEASRYGTAARCGQAQGPSGRAPPDQVQQACGGPQPVRTHAPAHAVEHIQQGRAPSGTAQVQRARQAGHALTHDDHVRCPAMFRPHAPPRSTPHPCSGSQVRPLGPFASANTLGWPTQARARTGHEGCDRPPAHDTAVATGPADHVSRPMPGRHDQVPSDDNTSRGHRRLRSGDRLGKPGGRARPATACPTQPGPSVRTTGLRRAPRAPPLQVGDVPGTPSRRRAAPAVGRRCHGTAPTARPRPASSRTPPRSTTRRAGDRRPRGAQADRLPRPRERPAHRSAGERSCGVRRRRTAAPRRGRASSYSLRSPAYFSSGGCGSGLVSRLVGGLPGGSGLRGSGVRAESAAAGLEVGEDEPLDGFRSTPLLDERVLADGIGSPSGCMAARWL